MRYDINKNNRLNAAAKRKKELKKIRYKSYQDSKGERSQPQEDYSYDKTGWRIDSNKHVTYLYPPYMESSVKFHGLKKIKDEYETQLDNIIYKVSRVIKRNIMYIRIGRFLVDHNGRKSWQSYQLVAFPWYVTCKNEKALCEDYLTWRDEAIRKTIDVLEEAIPLAPEHLRTLMARIWGSYKSNNKYKDYSIAPYMYADGGLWALIDSVDRYSLKKGEKNALSLTSKTYGRFLMEEGVSSEISVGRIGYSSTKEPPHRVIQSRNLHWFKFSSWVDSINKTSASLSLLKTSMKIVNDIIIRQFGIDVGMDSIRFQRGISEGKIFIPAKVSKQIIDTPLGSSFVEDWENVLMSCKLLGALRDQDVLNIDEYSFKRPDGGILVKRAKGGGKKMILTVFFLPEEKRVWMAENYALLKQRLKKGNTSFWRAIFRKYEVLNNTIVSTSRLVGDSRSKRLEPITAPLSELLRGHDLRRSAVPLLRSMGLSDAEIAELGGWSKGSIVFNTIYNMVDSDEYIRKMQSFFHEKE